MKTQESIAHQFGLVYQMIEVNVEGMTAAQSLAQGSRDRCVAAISRLSDQQMGEQVPSPVGGTTSRAELLSLLAFHQAYHSGQLGIARRIAGMEGAVKGPGQPTGTAAASR